MGEIKSITCKGCSKEFEAMRRRDFCTPSCRTKWHIRNSGRIYDNRKTILGKKVLNGRYCQRCARSGRKTPLKGADRVNCRSCQRVLANVYSEYAEGA